MRLTTKTKELYSQPMKVLFFNDSMLPKNVFVNKLNQEDFVARLKQGSSALVEVDMKPGQILVIKEWENVLFIGADDDIYEKNTEPSHL